MSTIKNEIVILGQPEASTTFSAQLRGFREDQVFASACLVHGPAGVGKSYAAQKYCDAIVTETESELIHVEAGSEFSRADSEASKAFVSALKDSALGRKTVVLVDECQLLPLKATGPMGRLWQSIIFGSGQGWGRVGGAEIEGKQIHFDLRNILLVMTTNHPDKVIRGNKEAASRRFLSIPIKPYGHEDIKKVIASYFDHKGLRVLADVRAKLERMHRGTLEALDDFAKRTKGFPQPLGMESFRAILPTCTFTLRGFKHEEIEAMKWMATTLEPTIARYVAQKFPGVDIPALYRHAQNQRVKIKGENREEPVPFIVMHGNRYVVTEPGKAFLKSL